MVEINTTTCCEPYGRPGANKQKKKARINRRYVLKAFDKPYLLANQLLSWMD